MMTLKLRIAATAAILALAGFTVGPNAIAADAAQAAAPLMLAQSSDEMESEDAMSGEGDSMSQDSMSEDSMSHDSMSEGDAMKDEKDKMKEEHGAMEGEGGEKMKDENTMGADG